MIGMLLTTSFNICVYLLPELFVVPSVPAVSAVLSSDQSNTIEERCGPAAAPPVYVTLRVPPLILKEGLLGSSSEANIQYKTD